MIESYLYQKLKDKKVRCATCNHRCLILPGKRGICGVRQNKDGKLYLLVYGKAIAAHIDPIEKKPLYHFLPGTSIYSIATVGCNFRCLWCQNDDISQAPKETGYMLPIEKIPYQDLPPEKVVAEALKYQCPSIAYTYTEPTIFLEYALDTMKLARKAKLKNVWVSNGYMTKETLDLITPYLDAINVDLKGFDEKNYQRKIHIEVTTLIVPGVNDDEKQLSDIAHFLSRISKNIPWHISRFFPAYKMTDTPPTPLATLKKAEQLGKEARLKYIHLGNV
jgi:pyruvate formate lyase activating enzyme